MARAQTKGAPISVRLPLELDAVLRERALADVQTPSAYAASLLSRLLVGEEAAASLHVASNTSTKAPYAPTTAQRYPPAAGCAHTDRVTIGGGLLRCKRCGAVRDVTGRWKVVQ